MNNKELNTAIYNQLADIARKVFNHVICAPGTYAVADIARAIYSVEGWQEVRKTDADGVTRSHRVPTVSRCWRSGFYWAEGYDPQADTITPAPAADTIESEAETLAPVAENVAEVAAPTDTPQADREAENERESRRALLLTIASRARRLAVAVAAVFVAALLLTLTPDRPTTGTAAPAAADLLAPVTPDTLAVAVFEPVSVERAAAPAADRPTVRKHHHARENKRESRPDLPAVTAPADTIASEADTLTVAALLTLTREAVADSLAPAGRELLADSLTITTPADSLTADTVAVAPADTITTAAPAAGTSDTIESERESETPADVITTTDTTDTDPVSEAESEPQADPVTPSTVAPVTPSPAGTPSPSPLML